MLGVGSHRAADSVQSRKWLPTGEERKEENADHSAGENQRLHGERRMTVKNEQESTRRLSELLRQAAIFHFRRFSLRISVWVRWKSRRILHRKKFRKQRKIRLKSEDFSRIWSECRDSNPRPLGPEGWSDIFSGHFVAFPRLSARKISQ